MSDTTCSIKGCNSPRQISASGRERTRCIEHEREASRKKARAARERKNPCRRQRASAYQTPERPEADETVAPCKIAGCTKPRHLCSGILYSVCHEHYLERIRGQRNKHRARQETHEEAIVQVRAGRTVPMPYSDATGRSTGTKCARFHGVTDEFRTGCHLCGWRGAE